MDPKHEEDAIAIVGMACRVPGAPDVATLWTNVRDGRSAIERWSAGDPLDAHVPTELRADASYVRARAMVEDIENFDARFFGYNPAEAALLDPQQRLFLECCWQALEGAGHIVPSEDELVGVFGGAALSSYLIVHIAPYAARHPIDPLLVNLGNAESFLTTRASYKMDLRGPSHSVSSACSTSLVAVHLACQSLLNQECDVALAGGVSINLSQRYGYRFVEGGVLSKDGTCRPFDASAGGIVFGSGAGVVALRRLRDAVEDGDHIHAVIRGSAINNDGANRIGYTAPSVDGQSEVISEALANASVDPADVAYIEAHGTGTALGDPIEVRALAKALGDGHERPSCAIGSLKGNLGHLDAAAGVLGLIKAALMLEHGELVPSLGCTTPSPLIDWESCGFHVQREGGPWPQDRPRIAGVSSFGMGGTNAHVVLCAAEPMPRASAPSPGKHLLLLSAKTPRALEILSSATADCIAAPHGPSLSDAASTLATTRRRFEHRRALVGADRTQAAERLRAPLTHVVAESREGRPVVFMFTGQGSQFVGMAKSLYDGDEQFRAEFDACRTHLHPELGVDIAKLVLEDSGDPEALRSTLLAQPALFALEVALARTFMRWGIQPAAMIGHSLGELVAACVAGVFSLADGARLVMERARVMQAQEPGAMVSVSLAEDELAPWLGGDVELAAINGPSLCVLSGPTRAIDDLIERLVRADVRHRRLHTSHAFHSRMMRGAAEAFATAVSRTSRTATDVLIASNRSGEVLTATQMQSSEYWGSLIEAPVRFAAGLATLASRLDDPAWIEIGPGRTLGTFVRQTLSGAGVVESLPGHGDRRDGGEVFLGAIGRAWTLGVDVVPPHAARKCWLPTHPFERQRCWIDAPSPAFSITRDAQPVAVAAEGDATPRHERPELAVSFTPPASSAENDVASIWCEVLGLQRVGLDDDFFELGGHSLLATTIVGRLRELFHTDVPLQRLFEAPTVRQIARLLSETNTTSDSGSGREHLLRLLDEMTTATLHLRGQA